MMKKGKYIFIAGLLAIISIMAIFIVMYYPNLENNDIVEKDEFTERYGSYVNKAVIAEAMDLDTGYVPIENSAKGDSYNGEVIQRVLYEYGFEYYQDELFNDAGVAIRAIDHDTGLKEERNSELFEGELGYHAKIIFDEDGNIKTEGDYEAADFFIFDSDPVYDDEGDVFKCPLNFEIEIGVAKELPVSSDLYNYNDNSKIIPFFVFTIILSAAIIMAYIFIYPYRYEEAANPFKTFKNWKAEINIALLIAYLSLVIFVIFFFGANTINGRFIKTAELNELPAFLELLPLGNIILWIMYLLGVSLAAFEIKRFIKAPLYYLKEQTIVGSLFKLVKRALNRIFSIRFDVSHAILKYVLIHFFLIVFLFFLFRNYHYFLAMVMLMIYLAAVFFIYFHHVDKVNKDYHKLLDKTKMIAEGNVNVEFEDDLGAFAELGDNLSHIKSGLKKAIEEEMKSQNMKTELITNVSHDLKTPITCIKNYSILLEREDLSEEDRSEYIKNIRTYTDRLSNLINDLFAISKANSGNIELDLKDLDLKSLIDQCLVESEEEFKERGLEVIKKYPSEELILKLDSDKTYRIFENLFSNISRYALSNSRVYVDVSVLDNVRIEIKNISEAPMNFTSEEIQKRFYKGDNSYDSLSSGLGLAIVKTFIEAEGGSFDIVIDGDLFKAIIEFEKEKPKS